MKKISAKKLVVKKEKNKELLMNKLLLKSLLIVLGTFLSFTSVFSMQQPQSPVPANEHHALIFLQVDNQTPTEYALEQNFKSGYYGPITKLPKDSKTFFEKAITLNNGPSAQLVWEKIFKTKLLIKKDKRQILSLYIKRNEQNNFMDFTLDILKLGKTLSNAFISLEPDQNDDIYSVRLTLAGQDLEQSTASVMQVKSEVLVETLRKAGNIINGEIKYPIVTVTPLCEIIRVVDRNELKEQQALPLLNFLINAGANVNQLDSCQGTPLHFAVLTESIEIMRLLLTHNANIYAQNIYGNTPLHSVVQYICGKPEMVRLLIQYGAKVTAKNNKGITPIGMVYRQIEEAQERGRVPSPAKVAMYQILKEALFARHHEYVKEQQSLVRHTHS